MDDRVRRVTELEVRRRALDLGRVEMAARIELCLEEGGGLNPRSLRCWEGLLNRPVAFFAEALCRCFDVASIALLGLGGPSRQRGGGPT